jgi:uncharacterized HhH-GPD family protein
MADIHFTETQEANELLADDHYALIVGMTLYQQVPVEKAFSGPYVLRERIAGPLTATAIASMDPDDLEEVFRARPALHRFPANMAKRVQAVSQFLVDEYGGDVSGLWEGVETADELLRRIEAIPGFGEYKARVYAAVLARRYGITPAGWDEDLPEWPNISEVDSAEARSDMKARKKAWKEAGG